MVINGLRSALRKAGTASCSPAEDLMSFGAVHLKITDMKLSLDFWNRIIGLDILSSFPDRIVLGTSIRPLVVLYPIAKHVFQDGFSGLYHFALHAPDISSFASIIARLQDHQYPFSPVDHTMSKSIYLRDPDGIQVEIALETPERFKSVLTTGGLFIEDSDGTVRAAASPLDMQEILDALPVDAASRIVSDELKVGHIHFYSSDVNKSNSFYRQLGFLQFNYLPDFLYADLGAGGVYQHRIANNAWHGLHRPLAPVLNAGLLKYEIIFASKYLRDKAVTNISKEINEDGYWSAMDPSGNKVILLYADERYGES